MVWDPFQRRMILYKSTAILCSLGLRNQQAQRRQPFAILPCADVQSAAL